MNITIGTMIEAHNALIFHLDDLYEWKSNQVQRGEYNGDYEEDIDKATRAAKEIEEALKKIGIYI